MVLKFRNSGRLSGTPRCLSENEMPQTAIKKRFKLEAEYIPEGRFDSAWNGELACRFNLGHVTIERTLCNRTTLTQNRKSPPSPNATKKVLSPGVNFFFFNESSNKILIRFGYSSHGNWEFFFYVKEEEISPRWTRWTPIWTPNFLR